MGKAEQFNNNYNQTDSQLDSKHCVTCLNE